MFHDIHEDEDGLALITSLFAVLILTGLAVLFVASATNLTKQSRISTTYEQAIHLSEAAIDDVIARVSTEHPVTGPFYVTKYETGPKIVYDYDPASDGDEAVWARAWAVEQAKAAEDEALFELAEGEAVGIRPVGTDGEPMDLIFGVSFIPTRAAPTETRVIKIAFQRKLLNPGFALQTGPACENPAPGTGGLQLQGNGQILDGDSADDVSADVHTNGSITVTGANVVVQGTLSAGPGGTVDSGVTQPDGTPAPTADDQPCEEIPLISPRDLYVRSMDHEFHVGKPVGDQWRWDLCYDPATGTPFARKPASNGVPCSNTTDQQDLSSVGQFKGWTFDFGKLVWRSNAVQGGIYYIQGASATINGSEETDNPDGQHVTVLLESLTTDASGTGTSCSGHSNTGNLCLAGNPKLQPAFTDTQFVVSRDIEFGGTPGSTFKGFITAGEQVGATGNAAIEGAVVAQDREDTSGSVLHQNIISGSMVLTYQADLNPPVDSVVQIVAWNELK